jgi:MSHA pilin protein MshD
MSARRRARGFSLVELALAIAVMGIAVAGAATLFFNVTKNSANPVVQAQAQLIADSYLDEILIKRFYDPDTGTVCPTVLPGKEALRQDYDNVCDYNGLSEAPRNHLGTAITALSAYTVTVTVANAGVSLNGIDNTGFLRVLRVDVTVTGPGGTSITATSYRTNYECDTGGTECKVL